MSISVDVVIVLYHSADCISEAIRSLSLQRIPLTLHLVDNCPGDGSLNAALTAAPDAHVIHPGGNIGFGGGCNLAVAATSAPYILLLNPDARLDPSCLDLLVQSLEEHSDRGAAGPLVCRSDNGSIDTAGMEMIVPGWARDRCRGQAPADAPASGTVNALSGGVLLLRRQTLKAIGRATEPFWEDLFLYNEDVELSLALTEGGWKLGYLREARAVHSVGGSEGDHRMIRALAARNRLLTAFAHTPCRIWLRPRTLLLWSRRILLDLPRLWRGRHLLRASRAGMRPKASEKHLPVKETS